MPVIKGYLVVFRKWHLIKIQENKNKKKYFPYWYIKKNPRKENSSCPLSCLF